MNRHRIAAPAVVLAAIFAAGAPAVPAAAQTAAAPAFDALDPKNCADEKGWITASTEFVKALATKGEGGQLQPQEYTDLSVWFQEMQNYLLQTGNTKGFCESLIQARVAHGF